MIKKKAKRKAAKRKVAKKATKKIAKKRPAKWPPPKDLGQLTSPRSKTTILLPAPPDASDKAALRHYLRAHAGILYSMDQSKPTLDDLEKREPFNTLADGTIRKWCQADGWVARRRAFEDSVLEGVRKRIGNRLVKAQIEMLEEIDDVRMMLRDKLMSVDAPKAKSLEGVARVYNEMSKTLNDVRTVVIDIVVPPVTAPSGAASNEPETPVDVELSAEEARIAALAVVNARRRRQLTAGGGDDGEA